MINEMNITSAQYVQDENSNNIGVVAIINVITMSVPLDPANRNYAEIMRQVAAGTLTIADAE